MLKENVLVFGSENKNFEIPGGAHGYKQLFCLIIEAALLPYYCSISKFINSLHVVLYFQLAFSS